MPRSEVYNIDCMELLRTLPDKAFSLAVADPPYGLDKKSVQGAGKLKGRTLNRHDMGWDVRPSEAFFEELRRVSEHQVIWGGNYFPLGPCRCFVCWDKQQVWENFSQCEMAWTDFDRPAKHVTLSNRGGHADSVGWHPTSKPVELYAYLLRTFATGGVILDPMMGSQASRIAAYRAGLDYVGCEIDPEYFRLGCERFDEQCRGITTLTDGRKVTQLELFGT